MTPTNRQHLLLHRDEFSRPNSALIDPILTKKRKTVGVFGNGPSTESKLDGNGKLVSMEDIKVNMGFDIVMPTICLRKCTRSLPRS